MNNTDVVKLQFKNSVTGQKNLQRYEEQLKKLKIALNNLPPGINISDDDVNNANKLAKNLNKANKEGEDTKKVFSATKFIAIAKGIGVMVQQVSKFTSVSADYVENLNLMNVAYHRTEESMDETSLAGEKLVNTLSEMYGLDESSLTRMVGIFKQLSNAMGLSNELGNRLTKTLTQMSIDVSSLYNVSLERASSVLQSSLAGQTKPIRGLAGADITESTLQVTLNTYGIDRTVRDLSYVEKRLVIVASLIDQLNESQNDYGKTIDSVSNQMRMFNEQVQRLTRAIGNVFIPILKAVLPYINGIMMVLTEIINMFAELLGFDESMLAGFAENTDSMLDFGDSMGEADKNAKKLKQSLRGFDKLNVITTPKDNDAGSGVGLSSDITDLFNQKALEYEKNLEKIKTKASEIRDNIMEWLGFTKLVDEETGKVSWKFERLTSGTVLGGLAVGGFIFGGVSSVLGFFKGIGKLLKPGTGDISKGTSKWADYFKNSAVILTGLAVIVTSWNDIYQDIKETNKEIDKMVKASGKHRAEIMKNNSAQQNINDLLVNANNLYKNVNSSVRMSNDNLEQVVKNSEYQLDVILEQLNAEGVTTETRQKGIEAIKKQSSAIEEVIKKLEEQGEDTSDLVTINNKYKDAIGEVSTKIAGTEKNWKDVLYQVGLTKKEVDKIDYAMQGLNEIEIKNKIFGDLLKELGLTENGFDTILDQIKDLKGVKEIATKYKINLNSATFKDDLKGLLTNMKNQGFGILMPTIEKLIAKIPRLKTGMDFVPRDYYGPVYLDYGERVLTKDENRDYMKGNSVTTNTTYQKATVSPTIVVKVGDEVVAKKVLSDLQDMATANGQVIEIGG